VLFEATIRAGGIPTRIGDEVRFRAASVFLWPEQSSSGAPLDDAEIEGKIIGFSDSGSERCVFAVVEVVKTQTLIVRASELEVVK
jgi:hypothetical protein